MSDKPISPLRQRMIDDMIHRSKLLSSLSNCSDFNTCGANCGPKAA